MEGFTRLLLIAIVLGLFYQIKRVEAQSGSGSGDMMDSQEMDANETCRFWCRTENKFYCCQYEDEQPSVGIVRPGKCPCWCPKDAPCPIYIMAPPRCWHDGQCQSMEKCCYDFCVDYFICKPILEPEPEPQPEPQPEY